MSIAIMTQCWPIQIRQTLKLLLLALADNADDDGVCWPSIDTIAAKCSTDRRTIFRQLLELESSGHITRETRRGHSNVYHIHPLQVTEDTPVSVLPPVAISHPPVTVTTHPPVVTESPTRGATVTQNHQEPSVEPPNNPKGRKSHDVEKPELPEWLPLLQWHGWIEARTKSRHPPTNLALRMAVAKLERYREAGHNVAQILAQSAMNNWSDLYEPKG